MPKNGARSDSRAGRGAGAGAGAAGAAGVAATGSRWESAPRRAPRRLAGGGRHFVGRLLELLLDALPRVDLQLADIGPLLLRQIGRRLGGPTGDLGDDDGGRRRRGGAGLTTGAGSRLAPRPGHLDGQQRRRDELQQDQQPEAVGQCRLLAEASDDRGAERQRRGHDNIGQARGEERAHVRLLRSGVLAFRPGLGCRVRP